VTDCILIVLCGLGIVLAGIGAGIHAATRRR
jgi:hypothetical protein